MGYHKEKITPGVYGKLSKITEEYLELVDASKQDNPIMTLIELSDIIGAIEGYAANFNITLDDLIKMSNATKRAFETGDRMPKERTVKRPSINTGGFTFG